MAVAALHHGQTACWLESAYEHFLRLFGTICAVPSVGRVALGRDGSTVVIWVQLTDDDEQAEHQIYEAEGRYLAAKATPMVELRVVFADEDEAAFPSGVPVIFSRS